MNVKITSSRLGVGGKIEVDGRNVSNEVTGVTVRMTAGERPVVALDMIGAEPEIDLEQARVMVSAQSHEVLVSLGWTPPTEGAESGESLVFGDEAKPWGVA